jgi:two-component system response regulator YesN
MGREGIQTEDKVLIRVMLVDDEVIVRKDLRQILSWEEHGYTLAAEAENGRKALLLLEEQDVDIIIADIEMPQMGGLELASRVFAEGKPVKFIFLTAYNNFEFARSSMRLGVDSYILKHELNEHVLLAELERLRYDLEKREQQKASDVHDAMQMLFSAKLPIGECQRLLRNNSIIFRPGSSFLLRIELAAGEGVEALHNNILSLVHRMMQHEDLCGCTVFSLGIGSVGALLTLEPANESVLYLSLRSCVNRFQERLRNLFNKSFFILVSSGMETEDALYTSHQYLQEIAGQLNFKEMPRSIFCDVSSEKSRERTLAMKIYIEEHYAEDITLEQLGSLIGVSEAYVSQLFKQQFGISFKTHLTNIRMQKAEEMLLAGRYKIQEISERLGYSSIPYFCLVFKQHFGLTPSEYKKI